MQTLQDQLTEVETQIAAENAKGADKDQNALAALEQKQAVILSQMDDEKAKQEQDRAAQVRIQDATDKAAYIMDNLLVEDLTMRDLSAGENEYQALRIAVQNAFIQLEEENITRISDIQAEESAEKTLLKQQITQLQAQLQTQSAQATRESLDYQSKLKNATDEIDRLNSQVDDLRKEIAVGARNAYKVSDVEQTQQLKQLADQIKASRIHVYDVEPDSTINPRNYTATRADNGESVTYNWTQAKNYIEIKDPNEVEQFRQQFANKETVSDSPLGNETTADVTPEVPLPEIPSVVAPEANVLPEVQLAVPAPTDSGQGQTVEERLSALEAHVFGYVKQAVA